MTSESRKREIKKCKSLEYVWTISLIQANIVMSTNMNSMVHTNKKRKIGTQNLEWKEHRYITQENQETTREETKRTQNYKNKFKKTSNKKAIIKAIEIATSTYQSILHSFLLLKNIFHCMDISQVACPFTYWWTCQ